MTKKLPETMNEKQLEYIYELITLTENISDEIVCTESDYNDNLYEQEEKQQLMDDLKKVEKHLRKTAKLFMHLHRVPDWGTE